MSTVFYKLIENSKEVHLIYDSDLNSFMSGEESRYIKQLELLKTDSHICERKVIEQKVRIEKNESTIIIKDDLINQKLDTILKKGISDITNLHLKLDNVFIDVNNSWLSPKKIRKISIIGENKMLLFDEMNLIEPIKIYNQYAKYPKIEQFNKKKNLDFLVNHDENFSYSGF